MLLPTVYEDAGLSGGTLERPGLQRLLADIDAGLVDQIVVYKVDRLTRSLSDFAKLVERLEAAGAVFVSVRRCCTAPEQIADLPVPVAESPGAVRIGHPERSHLVEYLAPNSVFNSLPRQRSSPHLRPDERLVTIGRVLHHASLGVA